MCETFPARLPRGAGLPSVPLLPYAPEPALAALAGTTDLVLAGARTPVAFFAYPGLPGRFVPVECGVHLLAAPGEDVTGALIALADEVAAGVRAEVAPAVRPDLPTGALTPATLAAVVGALLPERAIVVDESLTSGGRLGAATAGSPQHDWLTLTGGAIGQGLPTAVGAAVACPDRPVIGVQADGSAMYTITALWTSAREQLDVTTVLCNNGAYAILDGELERVGAHAGGPGGGRARDLLDLTRPDLDFVALATGMGVAASRATTADELARQFGRALAESGPHLIDAVLGRPR